jgi:hypothetical protein
MSIKEHLLKKIEIDRLARRVRNTIGHSGSEQKVDKEAMRKLLEMGPYFYQRERDLDLYIRQNGNGEKKKILVLDNDLKVYHSSVEDVAVRKSPVVREMISFRNVKKILSDTDVVISRKEDTLKTVHREAIEMLDFSCDKSDLDAIRTDGIVSLDGGDSEGVKEALLLFAELLGLVGPPKDFRIPGYEIWGGVMTATDGDKIFGPIVLYNSDANVLRMVEEPIRRSEKKKIEWLHQVAAGQADASFNSDAVLNHLMEKAKNAEYNPFYSVET